MPHFTRHERNISRPANLEESFWVPGEFQFGRGFAYGQFPTHRYHPVIQHNKSAAKKTIQSYFLVKNSINEERSLHVASFSTSKEYIYLLKLLLKYPSIYFQWHLLLTALPEHHWSLPCDRQSPLHSCSPFLSPKRLCQCSGLLCIGSCFW